MYKKINGKYEHKFAVDKDGLYSITIEAACQKRNDLKVGIDETKLRELPAENKIQYYKIPSSWNGNELKGTSKTVVLILGLLRGEHSLKFEAEGEAELLAEPKTNFLERKSPVAAAENIQSPKKNRQPWVTAVLINLPLNFLDISATCQKRFLDSDDLQLIIDGEIQKHPGSLWWGKNWLWQGRLSKGMTQTKRIYKKLDRGIHYIELWADVSPTIEYFQLNLGAENSSEDDNSFEGKNKNWWINWKDIKEYTYKGVSGEENYNRYDDEIKEAVAHWNYEFFSQKYPPDEPLDPNLVKAMIYVESRMGYGSSPTKYPAFPDVMQVGDPRNPAIHTLNNDGWIDPNGYKLWTLAIGLLISSTLVAGLFFYQSKQNKFYAYRETADSGNIRVFDFYVKTLDGLRWKKYFLTEYRTGWPFDTFYDEKIFANLWTPLNEGEKLLAVSGKDIADYQMTAMVSYKNGEFRLISKLDEYGTSDKTFNADQISIENLDDDPEEEIVEDHFVYYDNADDQIWKSYYDFDRSAGVYRFVKKRKMPVWQARTERISEL